MKTVTLLSALLLSAAVITGAGSAKAGSNIQVVWPSLANLDKCDPREPGCDNHRFVTFGMINKSETTVAKATVTCSLWDLSHTPSRLVETRSQVFSNLESHRAHQDRVRAE